MRRAGAVAGVVVIVAIVAWLAHSWRTTEPTGTRTELTAGSLGTSVVHSTTPQAQPPAWFGSRSTPERRIAGRVTFEGAPVVGAIVSLHSILTTAGASAERRTSAADGTFDFGPHRVAGYDVTAEATDKVAAILHIDLADPVRTPTPERLELRLTACGALVTGSILDASGGPIARARVRREGLAGVVADDKGTYKLCVPRGESSVEYAADGYGSVLLALDVAGELRQDIVLVPEGVLTVRTVRAEDGKPVADAIVFVFPQDWSRDRPAGSVAMTDGDGRARVTRLVPGQYRVNGLADGMQSEAPVSVQVEVGTSPEVILRLTATARIAGKVMRKGVPVANAQVVAVRKSPVGRSVSWTTGPDGAFMLDRVSLGEVVFTAFPFDVKSPTSLQVDRAKLYDGIVIEVEKLGSIRGRVTRGGKPVEGVPVCCVQTASFEPRHVSDAEGRYEFLGVAEGKYEIGAGNDDAFAIGTPVSLARGEDRVVDIELDLAAAISGTVVDREGAPVAGVFVRWTHETTGDLGRCVTDARGRYRCSAMSGGAKYRSAVFPAGARAMPFPTADGAAYPAVELADGSSVIDNVAIAIDYRRLSISGRVVDGSGAGIADADVKALAIRDAGPPIFNSWTKLPRTFTGADGSFTVSELVTGSYALQARSADGGEGVAATVAAGATGVVLTIDRPGSIVGKLAGFPTPPVVYARPIGSSFRLIPGIVDGTTAFRISALRPGRYLVGAQTTFEGDAQIADVHTGESVQLAMTAKGRGVIEGTVLDFRTRAPIANVACHAVLRVDAELSVTNWDTAAMPHSDAAGHFVLDPAPAGTVNINCRMPSFRWSSPSADAVVAAGGRAAVQLLAAEVTQENPGASGLELDWNTTAARISRVIANSAGAKAGLMVGDLVVAVGGARVEGLNGDGVYHLIESYPVGSQIPLEITRAGVHNSIMLVLLPNTGTE